MRVEGTAHLAHLIDRRMGGARLAWTTPAAGAKSRALCNLRPRKENHLLALRPSARARWPAINPRRAHGEYEGAVKPGVSRQNTLPLVVGSFTRAFYSRHISILAAPSLINFGTHLKPRLNANLSAPCGQSEKVESRKSKVETRRMVNCYSYRLTLHFLIPLRIHVLLPPLLNRLHFFL